MKDCWYVSLSIRFAIDRAHRSEAHAVWKRVFWCGVVGKNKLIDRWGDENKDITRRTPRGLTASWKPAPIKSYRVHSCLLDSCSICHRADGALWKRWVGIYDNDGEKIHCVLIFGRAVGRLSVGLGWVGQLLPLLIRSRGREGCVTGHIQQHTCIMSLGVSKRPPTLTASDLFLYFMMENGKRFGCFLAKHSLWQSGRTFGNWKDVYFCLNAAHQSNINDLCFLEVLNSKSSKLKVYRDRDF